MKLALVAMLSLFTSAAMAAKATPIMVCNQIEVFEQDDNGNGTFQPNDLVIEVFTAKNGTHGYEGVFTSKSGTHSDLDVDVQNVPPSDLSNVQDMASILAPQVKWSDVKDVRVGNIGVQANLQDAGGVMIFELIDAKKVVLAKIFQMGWAYGRCGL